MRVGFIHGVLNTDNCAISGETIDFGPCAMMGKYDPTTVYSSIDRGGRYAFGQQPGIIMWNMTRLAECLLPLIDPDTDKAIGMVKEVLAEYMPAYEIAFQSMMLKKLGVYGCSQEGRDVETFIKTFLQLMEDKKLDYTIAFIDLADSLSCSQKEAYLRDMFGDWYSQWRQWIGDSTQEALDCMSKINPLLIPRNHHVEAMLARCENSLSCDTDHPFLLALKSPYTFTPHTAAYQDVPEDGDRNYKTFCGT